MQAMLVDSIRPGEWIYEIKFDGYRAVALRNGNETRILSRNDKDWGRKFPEVKDAVSALAVKDAVIDGEIVGRQRRIILSVIARIRHASGLQVQTLPGARQTTGKT